MTRAGTAVAARRASASEAPRAQMFRTASIMVTVLPEDAFRCPATTDGGVVGHESHATVCSAPHEPRGLGRQVHAVHDHLDDHVVPREGNRGDPRVAVVERAHRVEDVRHRARSRIECGVGFLRGRIRVAE